MLLSGCGRRELPPTYGQLLRLGDNLTYAAHRALLPRGLAREYGREHISSFPAIGTTNPADPNMPLSATLGQRYAGLRAGAFRDYRVSIEGRVAQARHVLACGPPALPQPHADHAAHVRRRLVGHRGVDGCRAGSRPGRGRHAAGRAVRPVPRLRRPGGRHRHDRCAAPADAPRLRDERAAVAGPARRSAAPPRGDADRLQEREVHRPHRRHRHASRTTVLRGTSTTAGRGTPASEARHRATIVRHVLESDHHAATRAPYSQVSMPESRMPSTERNSHR